MILSIRIYTIRLRHGSNGVARYCGHNKIVLFWMLFIKNIASLHLKENCDTRNFKLSNIMGTPPH